jgi:hypothetical protein
MAKLKHENIDRCTYSTTLAKLDPATCAAPGLFRLFSKNDLIPRVYDDGSPMYELVELRDKMGEPTGMFTEKRDKKNRPIRIFRRKGYELNYAFNGYCTTYQVPTGLGPEDLRLLQCIVALATQFGKKIDSMPKTNTGRLVREALGLRHAAMGQTCMQIESSLYMLAKEMGYKAPGGGSVKQQIRESLARLFAVSITVVKQGRSMELEAYNLISHLVIQRDDKGVEEMNCVNPKTLFVGLNPQIARAILDGGNVRGIGYTHIDMNEVRSIKHDGTRILHWRLCQTISQGSHWIFKINTLCQIVWPEEAPPKSQKNAQRARAMRNEYLPDLESLGWTITEVSASVFKISRPNKN